jgi:putative selenate reductase
MPADREEIHELHEEGIEVLELARPVGLLVSDGRLAGLRCLRTAYAGERDAAGRKIAVDVPGSEFEVLLDTLVLAISQSPVLDLFGATTPALTTKGYLATDPETLATSVMRVYAAGDVSAHGPASIVRAAADGKRAARAIAQALGLADRVLAGTDAYRPQPRPDVQALTVRRAHREYRVPVRTTGPEARDGFEETVLGYTVEEAVREAGRCLDCDQLCSLCVGVCPNLAIATYESTPVRWQLPALGVHGDRVTVDGATDGGTAFAIDQRFQVAVLTDLCNECGTCVTACPTSGRPYVDKPRLYLDRADFESQPDNAFRLVDAEHIEGRFDGATHRLEVGGGAAAGQLRYEAPGLRVTIDRATFSVLEARTHGTAPDGPRSLIPAATLAALLEGITGSLPHLPLASTSETGTRIPAPAMA